MDFLPAELVDRIVERLRADEPDVVAVVLCGSFARGAGDEYSDADLIAFTSQPPRRAERGWLEPREGQRPLQVSLGAETLDDFLGAEEEPAEWALGFAVREPLRVLWATPQARARIGENPAVELPAAPPELGDFAELAMKVRRARASGDAVELRYAARLLAEYGARLLRPFNSVAPVGTPVAAITAARDLAMAPAHYREDFQVCFGLTPAGDAAMADAALRLARELLAWLRERLAGQDFPPDDIASALLDGSLQAYIES